MLVAKELPLGLSQNEVNDGLDEFPSFLYIIYLELCSLLGSSMMTRDLTKWLYVLNGASTPLGQIWAYLVFSLK